MKKWIAIAVVSLVLVVVGTSILTADDTDLYVAGVDTVQPNCLIIFDNSGSMNEQMPTVPYDPTFSYPNVLEINPNAVYYKSSGGSWDRVYRNTIGEILCDDARDALSTYGFFNGRLRDNSECGGWKRWYLRTGNYRNYLEYRGPGEDRPKLTVAKEVVQAFVSTTNGVRFGAMMFNYSEGGRLVWPIRDMTPQNRSDLHNAIGQVQADTWTPLAETLYEAGLYFQGAPSYFNRGVTYTSPVQYWCQKNYIIIVTDGESTQDQNSILQTIGTNGDTDGDAHEPGHPQEKYYESNGSDYLDDVAKVLREMDTRPDLEDTQNIITYTVGFTVRSELLEDTAENGGGKYYYCYHTQHFATVLQQIIEEILEQSTSYVAPVVPISQMEKGSSGNRLYLALFKPAWRSFWKGNIKKFAIATTDNPTAGIKIGDIIDSNGNPVLDSRGRILDSALSFWGDGDPDGGEVERGGAGAILLARSSQRMIYTYTGITTDLADPTNAFSVDNPGITPELLGFESNEGAAAEREKLIQFIHGYDSYDENGNGNTAEKRDWILGAFLHSRPLIIHYGQGRSVIFAGANDGMLHAFDDETGEELWAFIPPDLLERLKDLTGEALVYYVDGSPRAYVVDRDNDGTIESSHGDRVILAFGERRGGNRYFALDVTSPQSPQLLWQIGPHVTGYSEMGQSWSTPIVGRIRYGDGEKMAFFIGGGYDENQDSGPGAGQDAHGRAIYIVDALTGGLVWNYSHAQNPLMANSIPSDIALVDTTGDGYVDRLYVGDTGAKMWRFDIGSPSPSNWTSKIVFDSGPQRKIFYPPDVCLENGGQHYEMLFFGTGDREDPKDITVCNRIYAVKDKNGPFLTETDLQDVTDALLGGTDTENGWYLRLNQHLGEKVLSSPVVYFGTAYFTTFMPDSEQYDDPCYVGQGRGRLYALGYKTGDPVFDLDGLGGIGGIGDRSSEIGIGIPSGVVIAIFGEIGKGYVGVGGGIHQPPVSNRSTIMPMWWREVF
jgi:type IV pilus assembly protein PilY1